LGFSKASEGNINFKSKVKGLGQECPSHTGKGNINNNVGGDGQECPSHTIWKQPQVPFGKLRAGSHRLTPDSE
jgi:hypothetical protein